MILVLVDPQRGFFDPVNLAAKLRDLLDLRLFRAVVATKFVNTPEVPFERFSDWPGLNAAEQEICGEIAPYLDAVIAKSGFNAAIQPVLHALQEFNGGRKPKAVLLAGTDTEACILASAMGFFEQGIRPFILVDYCASHNGLHVHNAGLMCLEYAIGSKNLLRGDPATFAAQVKTLIDGECL